MLGVDPGVLEIRIPAEMGNGIFSVSGVEDLLLVLHNVCEEYPEDIATGY